MTIGIKYVAFGDATGYALAALAYIRALHHAGVPIWPLFVGKRDEQGNMPLGRAIVGDSSFADVPALMRELARPIAYDTVVAHMVPDLWRQVHESGKRLVGYTVWETDALPEHWPDILNKAERILVPCRANAELFARSGVSRPVHVVPHIRRSGWSPSAREEGAALRQRLGIPADHFVFYTIAVWDPRKAVAELIEVFARAFSIDDRVTLLVKTSARVKHATAVGEPRPRTQNLVARILEEAERETGRRPANVVLIAVNDISGGEINAIHAAGDAYVSLTHGEGWALGPFDAATLGKPVIITGWGGQLDYLGSNYPGLVRYEMTPVAGWYPLPGYRPTQRWATADRGHATELMRAVVAGGSMFTDAAESVRKEIDARYSEPVVMRQFMDAIDG